MIYNKTTRDDIYFLQRNIGKVKDELVLVGKRIGESHEFVDDNKGDPEPSTESEDLLTDRITKSQGSRGIFIHQLGHSGVGDDLTGSLDDVAIEVADEIGRDVYKDSS